MVSNDNGIMRKPKELINYKRMSLQIEINKDKLQNLETIADTKNQMWFDLNDKKYEKRMKINFSLAFISLDKTLRC